MTLSPRSLLILVAAVLFAVAALWTPPAPPRFSLTAAGLCCFALAWLFP